MIMDEIDEIEFYKFKLNVALEFVSDKDISTINEIFDNYPNNIDTWEDDLNQIKEV